MISLILITADASDCGRVDKLALPDQAVMELLISRFTSGANYITKATTNMTDFTEWHGVILLNDDVTVLEWDWLSLEGSLRFEWLPSMLVEGWFYHNALSGCITLLGLPETLNALDVSHNRLSGSIDFTALPACLKELYVNDNTFVGSLDSEYLPKSLRIFQFHDNLGIRGDSIFLSNLVDTMHQKASHLMHFK